MLKQQRQKNKNNGENDVKLKLKRRLTIANPTSAFLRAGASFVPSPVTATTSW